MNHQEECRNSGAFQEEQKMLKTHHAFQDNTCEWLSFLQTASGDCVCSPQGDMSSFIVALHNDMHLSTATAMVNAVTFVIRHDRDKKALGWMLSIFRAK